MNLAINALSSRQGGGQVYLSNLLRYAEDYPQVKTYVLTTPEFANLYKFPTVEVIECKVSSWDILSRIIWEKFQLPRLLEKLQTDLVFCPGGIINFTPPKGCKTAVTFQNMMIFDKINRSKYQLELQRMRLALLEKASKNSFRKADLIIFLTNHAKKVINQEVPDRKGNWAVIPHGLERRFRTSCKNDMPRCEAIANGEYLLYVSVIDTFKAHIEVLKAYHILTGKRNTKEKLVFVGPSYKKYERQLRSEIRKLNLQNKVIISGAVSYSDMPSVYHYAKAHIFASTCENCPNIVIESLGSGKALFLSNIAPMPEIAQKAAFYFNPYKPYQLAKLLLSCLDNENLLNEYGKKAYEQSFKYDWQVTAEKTFGAFFNLFDSNLTQKPDINMKEVLTTI